MIQQGDEVKLVGKVNFVEGYMAEVQVGPTKFWLPVDLLKKVIPEMTWGVLGTVASNPPDLGVAVGDGTNLGERLS